MRLIDADACIDYIRNNNQHAWEALAYAPTIYAVPVVRCKECDRGFGSPVCPIQSKGWAINKDTFFCAWGERREP